MWKSQFLTFRNLLPATSNNIINAILPDLSQYRAAFLQKGIQWPLKTVMHQQSGLLKDLPQVSPDKTGWPYTEETDPGIYHDTIQWPKLSIVMPSYNQGEFVEQTIRAVLLQNYPNLEFIVIDGGSTDNSRLVIEKYAPWISYYQIEKDNGQGNAINLGFSLASGDYYAWINSDDYYLKGTFGIVINKFLDTRTDFVYSYAYSYDVDLKKFEVLKVPRSYDYFLKIPSLVQPSCFWSAKIHQPIWEQLHCSLDYELWLRLVKGQKRQLIRRPLSVATVHRNAKTQDPAMKQKWEEDHVLIWSQDGHGPVPEWKKIVLINRLRLRIYRLFKLA
jgi:glycosyltransferase involved in cell wall biosynthesis